MTEQTSPTAGSPKAATSPTANQSPTERANHSSPAVNTAAVQAAPIPTEPLPEDIHEHIVADDDEGDSGYATSLGSDGTSVTSSIYRGYLENGRKYQTLKEEGYPAPSDELQFEVLYLGHLLYKIMDSQEKNPLFRSPISDKAQNILDIGTGDASWAIDVADTFPDVTVRGVDLFPPPTNYTAPNLVLEVDDITKPWMFTEKFDLIHLRIFMGACNDLEWRQLYKEAYNNLVPGGFIEQMEISVDLYCDDETMPRDSDIAKAGAIFHQCANGSGKPFDTIDTMRRRIEAAGFINIQEKNYKIPIGGWPRHPVYKDAGRVNLDHWKAGMEGWMQWLLCRFGPPMPWSPEECQVWFAKLRRDLNSKCHIYQMGRRIWAQKPYDDKVHTETKVEVQNLASNSEEDKPDLKKQKVSATSHKNK